MNTPHEIDELQWQAQERARRNARLHLSSAADDAASAPYRLVAQALRNTPMPALPPEFARDVARRVARAGDGLERALTLGLAVALGIGGTVTALVYGAAWWQASASLLASGSPAAAGWLAALAGCVGLSWLTGRLRQAVSAR
ncbi:hypothetical protein [Chiayiivirga flava]|uniref:Uncharacterized protein n=1 Tax=Chiayiivirga flava TaxID=659595 RepID=A0A7W8D9U2_9GAMM|nr:hypothetical protein [Chiayiivirga flava]MBB5209221.1 hypothetical protein [Chiayiivirga flava]